MTTKGIWLCLGLFAALSLRAQEGTPELFRGVTLVLPKQAAVTSHWIVPPQSEAVVDSVSRRNAVFYLGVDPEGAPLIGHSGLYVLHPVRQYQYRLSQPFTSMASMDNGALYLSTEAEFGLALAEDRMVSDERGFPIVPFQPVAALPFPGCTLAAGSGDCLYFFGFNHSSALYEVYLLQPRTVRHGDTLSRVLSGYQKVFSSEAEVTAVSGDDQQCFVALENLVLRVSLSDGRVSRYAVCPCDQIDHLLYSPQAGLIYSSLWDMGYAGPRGTFEFYSGQWVVPSLRADTLYLMFPESLGVLALEHLSGIRALNPDPERMAWPDSLTVPRAQTRFFPYAPPDYKGSEYAEAFDRGATYYIACQLELSAITAGMSGTHTVSAQWFRGDHSVRSASQTCVLTPGVQSKSMMFPLGELWQGNLYPGTYRVELLWDGVFLTEGRFSVYGEVNGFDALAHQDTELLAELLVNGLDPNVPRQGGLFPYLLHVAAAEGSPEDVRLLIQHGAKVNQKDQMGETALFLCDWFLGNPDYTFEKARLLIAGGADVNIRNNRGFTPVASAMTGMNKAWLKFLLDAGANPNLPLEDGTSPLRFALSYGQMDLSMLEFLLSSGVRFTRGSELAEFRSYLDDRPMPDVVSSLLRHGRELGILVTGGSFDATLSPSVLYPVMTGIHAAAVAGDRPGVQYRMEVARLLRAAGARLREDEEPVIANKALFEELEPNFLLPILLRHDELLLSTAAFHEPRTYPWIMKRLLEVIRKQIDAAESLQDIEEASQMCKSMRVLADAYGAQEWPELYLYSGILDQYMQQTLGRSGEAATFYRKYLDLVPAGTDVSKVSAALKKLDK